jgi:threonylcarbamoyladenosine tRNA methylthiotransferase CDKAL1
MNKIFIKTFGCSLNTADAEIMAGILKESGFNIVKFEDDANIFIINTCVVKEPTEKKIISYIEKIKEKSQNIIITGCMPQTMPEKLSNFTLLGPSQITHIVEAVEETINGNNLILLVPENIKKINLPKIRRNKVIEIIPISSGCLGNCSYCIVKKARGELFSYPEEEILKNIKKAIQSGAKEIWLTAQDTGSYGKDINTNLVSLISNAIKINGEFKIRIGMMNPDQLIEFIDDFLPLFKSDKLFRFIHIPIQSGSDNILKKMNRKYTSKEALELIEKIKEEYIDMTIATDIICGFPGETEEDFSKTIEFMKITKIPVLNISRYWDRKETKSSTYEDKIEPETIKDRILKLKDNWEWTAIHRSKEWKNWSGNIIIDEIGKNNTFIGRNYAYIPVIVQGNYQIGQKLKVKIVNTAVHDLYGEEIKPDLSVKKY